MLRSNWKSHATCHQNRGPWCGFQLEGESFKACSLRSAQCIGHLQCIPPGCCVLSSQSPGSPKVRSRRTRPARTRAPDIELQGCLACGEACFVQVSESLPLLVTWDNGLLATTEVAFSIGGNGRTPNPGAMMASTWRTGHRRDGRSLLRPCPAAHRPHLGPMRSRFRLVSCSKSSGDSGHRSCVSLTPDELLSRLT